MTGASGTVMKVGRSLKLYRQQLVLRLVVFADRIPWTWLPGGFQRAAATQVGYKPPAVRKCSKKA